MKSLVVLIIVSIFFTSCKTTGLKIGSVDVGKLVNQGVALWDANNIDEKQEIQFGQNMSAVLLGARPLIEDPKINQYINLVGMWLASNSARPDLPWRFGVIDSSAINAFAAPGGFVFITSGFLMQLENEAQLAAVLAHEIIHVVEQHHLNAIKSGAMRNVLTQTLFISADAYQNNNNTSRKKREYSAWAKKVTGMAQNLYTKGLERTDEYVADQSGIRLLAKSGYDPFSYVQNLQILEAISPDDSSLALMYKTHPTPTQRLHMLEEQLVPLEHVKGVLLAKRYHAFVFK
ncbi:MAG: putative Zn-dependent protease [Alteromonadaceae bacterium]|jgi:predicted Zn-dependent protease